MQPRQMGVLADPRGLGDHGPSPKIFGTLSSCFSSFLLLFLEYVCQFGQLLAPGPLEILLIGALVTLGLPQDFTPDPSLSKGVVFPWIHH